MCATVYTYGTWPDYSMLNTDALLILLYSTTHQHVNIFNFSMKKCLEFFYAGELGDKQNYSNLKPPK